MRTTKYEDIFKIEYKMLKSTGAWPEENASFRYKLKGAFYFLLVVALEITMLMEAFADITDFARLSEILYILTSVTIYIFKYVTIFLQRDIFTYMMDLLKNPIFMAYPADLDVYLDRRIKISTTVSNFYRSMLLICVILMAISPFFTNSSLPFSFPYDTGKYRYLMFVFQVGSISVVGWTHTSFDSLSASLIGLAAAYLQILGKKILRVLSCELMPTTSDGQRVCDDTHIEVIKALKQCSQHHLAIIEYIDCIEKVFSFCVLIQFLTSIVLICNTLFHFVLIKIGSAQFFMLLSYLICFSIQLLMYCWFGNEVIWMSNSIGDACYFSNWYNCNNEVRKHLFIIMERSKRPLKITVFKFSVLSLDSFATIIRWSYSYFMVLFKLYKEASQ